MIILICSPPLIISYLLLYQLFVVTPSKRLHTLPSPLLVLLFLLENVFDINFLLVWLLSRLIIEIVKKQPLLANFQLSLRYHSSLKEHRRVNTGMLFRVFFRLLFHLIQQVLGRRLLLLRILLVGLHQLVQLTNLILS